MEAYFVQPKGSALKETKIQFFVSTIYERIIKEFPNSTGLKMDIEFLLFACNLIENIVINKKKEKKFNKLAILYLVFERIYGILNVEDKALIEKNIEYLLTNKKIKLVPLYKKIFRLACRFIEKKFID